jgi:hypothetical protein
MTVQPITRVHALRLKPLRDKSLELVDPVVQRLDPVNDLGRRSPFVLTFASHSTQSTAGFLKESSVRNTRDHVPDVASTRPEP